MRIHARNETSSRLVASAIGLRHRLLTCFTAGVEADHVRVAVLGRFGGRDRSLGQQDPVAILGYGIDHQGGEPPPNIRKIPLTDRALRQRYLPANEPDEW